MPERILTDEVLAEGERLAKASMGRSGFDAWADWRDWLYRNTPALIARVRELEALLENHCADCPTKERREKLRAENEWLRAKNAASPLLVTRVAGEPVRVWARNARGDLVMVTDLGQIDALFGEVL